MTTAVAQLQIPLDRHGDDFIATLASKVMAPGHGYRLIVRTPEGASVYRRDPYALEADFKSSWCVAVDPNMWTWQPWKTPTFDTYLIYEMHVGSFTPEGTFEAAQAKLKHIMDLGFTCVQVMPVTEHSDLWGYNPRQLMAVHGGYGSAANFQVRPASDSQLLCGLANAV
jgi:1,4-alpha-glucan branching enzyme